MESEVRNTAMTGQAPQSPLKNDDQNDPTAPFPWENRSLGIFRRFWDTCVGAVFNPWHTFKRMPPAGGYLLPWFYLALCTLAFLVIEEVVRWFVPSVSSSFVAWKIWVQTTLQMTLISPAGVGEGLQGDIIIWTFVLALQLLFMPFIGAAIVNALLRLFGASRNGYQATFRASAYVTAIGFISAIPFVGRFIGIIWGVVVFVVALKKAHKTDYWRVILAFLVLSLLIAIPMILALLKMGSH